MVGPPLPLTELSFDLQVHICGFLQPPQIIALRQTSKAFHQVTTQRIVWIHALERICHDNFLFLPTFSILDMSVPELECAATTPFRLIALSSSRARKDMDHIQLSGNRTIKDPIPSALKGRPEDLLNKVYLVPGGRYLVLSGWRFLSVWDLENVSDSKNGSQIGIWETVDKFWSYINFLVHPTPDGLGIRILATSEESTIIYPFYVFEIYPQQQTPKLEKYRDIIFRGWSQRFTYFLSGNRAVFYTPVKTTFIVWDFVQNTLATWSITLRVDRPLQRILRVTETVIIIHDTQEHLLIFEIPPLKAKTVPLDINGDLPIATPILSYMSHVDEHAYFQKPDSWYSGDLSSLPLSVGISGPRSNNRRYKLDIACDFSTIHLVPISEESTSIENLREYRICDDRFVKFSDGRGPGMHVLNVCGGFGLPSDGQAHSLGQARNMCFMPPLTSSHSSFCPVSARFAFIVNNNIVISDFLKEPIVYCHSSNEDSE